MPNRRNFLYTSAGFTAIMIAPGRYLCARPDSKKNPFDFKPYRPGKTVGKVMQVTPDDGLYLQTFYDVCPFSPSQRYLAVTRLPFQDRQPKPGDTADVCVIDLEDRTIDTVYTTKGWGVQLGANLNWGTTDRYLYTNDVINGEAVCVRLDLESGETKAFAGPMYHIAPDASCVVGFPLDLINATQFGYGVPVDWENPPQISMDDFDTQGLWRTDLKTNEKTLLVSIAALRKTIPDLAAFKNDLLYLFHSKFNSKNTRIMQVFRSVPQKGRMRKPMLFTFKTDGSDIQLAIDAKLWGYGGHHPNWHPDGTHLIMNLKPDTKTMRFCMFKYDGSDFRVLTESFFGSGHPSVTPDTKYLVTDCYVHEKEIRKGLPNNEVPIRLINLQTDTERHICSIYTLGKKGTLRLDPHPVWSRDYKKVCFNGAPEGNRQVFIADISGEM
ncbi:hypothetical protein GF373_09200 [bacterium]|nr:hypothetical protein [bacterium]